MTDQVLWTESLIDLIGVCAMPATKVAGLGFYVVITFSVLGDGEAGNGAQINAPEPRLQRPWLHHCCHRTDSPKSVHNAEKEIPVLLVCQQQNILYSRAESLPPGVPTSLSLNSKLASLR
jgi:hypothetical protein